MNEEKSSNSNHELTSEELYELDDLEEELDESFTEKNTIHSTEEDRCYWCNEFDSNERPLFRAEFKDNEESKYFFSCSKVHEEKVINFYDFFTKWRIFYSLLVLIIPICLVIFIAFSFAFFGPDITFLLFYIIFTSLGTGLLIFPLLGNKTVEGLGLKRSILIGRILGGVLLAIGIILILIHGYSFFLM